MERVYGFLVDNLDTILLWGAIIGSPLIITILCCICFTTLLYFCVRTILRFRRLRRIRSIRLEKLKEIRKQQEIERKEEQERRRRKNNKGSRRKRRLSAHLSQIDSVAPHSSTKLTTNEGETSLYVNEFGEVTSALPQKKIRKKKRKHVFGDVTDQVEEKVQNLRKFQGNNLFKGMNEGNVPEINPSTIKGIDSQKKVKKKKKKKKRKKKKRRRKRNAIVPMQLDSIINNKEIKLKKLTSIPLGSGGRANVALKLQLEKERERLRKRKITEERAKEDAKAELVIQKKLREMKKRNLMKGTKKRALSLGSRGKKKALPSLDPIFKKRNTKLILSSSVNIPKKKNDDFEDSDDDDDDDY